MRSLHLTKGKLLILGKSLYSFMYNRKYLLFPGKSLQFQNFVFVGKKLLSIGVLRSAHTGVLSSCNKSRHQVPACELVIFASNRVAGWALRLVPGIQTRLNFSGCLCDLFFKTVRVNCSCDKSRRPVPSC